MNAGFCSGSLVFGKKKKYSGVHLRVCTLYPTQVFTKEEQKKKSVHNPRVAANIEDLAVHKIQLIFRTFFVLSGGGGFFVFFFFF